MKGGGGKKDISDEGSFGRKSEMRRIRREETLKGKQSVC
jgi:hypothetical protein